MPRHSFGQAVADSRQVVSRVRKEMKQSELAHPGAIHVVRPINQRPAPDHDADQREINPVKPADRRGMFGLDSSHPPMYSRPGRNKLRLSAKKPAEKKEFSERN